MHARLESSSPRFFCSYFSANCSLTLKLKASSESEPDSLDEDATRLAGAIIAV